MLTTLLMVLSLAALVAGPAEARSCHSSAQDAARVQRAIQSFYDALAKDDRPAFERTVTRDFQAFEQGERYTADTLFKAIEDSHRSGRLINWKLSAVMVRVECNTALATWDIRGSAGVQPKIAPRNWLESALMRRSPTGWRMEFLHSTVMPPVEKITPTPAAK